MAHLLIGSLLPLDTLVAIAAALLSFRPPPTSPAPLVITAPCAVLYRPDVAKIDRLKRRGKEADFYVVADDQQWYLAQTRTYLEKRGIKIVETSTATFRFVPHTGPAYVVDRRADRYAWGLLLFDGRHAPREADLVDPEADVRAVLGK